MGGYRVVDIGAGGKGLLYDAVPGQAISNRGRIAGGSVCIEHIRLRESTANGAGMAAAYCRDLSFAKLFEKVGS